MLPYITFPVIGRGVAKFEIVNYITIIQYMLPVSREAWSNQLYRKTVAREDCMHSGVRVIEVEARVRTSVLQE